MGRGGVKKKSKKDEGPEYAKMDEDIFKVENAALSSSAQTNNQPNKQTTNNKQTKQHKQHKQTNEQTKVALKSPELYRIATNMFTRSTSIFQAPQNHGKLTTTTTADHICVYSSLQK
jgi:hypothetical protein